MLGYVMTKNLTAKDKERSRCRFELRPVSRYSRQKYQPSHLPTALWRQLDGLKREIGGDLRRKRISIWRRKLVSNSANTPSMSRKHLPAAVPVSIGCSVGLQGAAICGTLDRVP
jgi:hypothetical protein